MMCRLPVTALVAGLLAVLAAACSLIPSGACDEYQQIVSQHSSSCTPDGKVTSTRATGCSDPDGVTYTTTTTACGAGEHCVADDFLGAVCVLPCVSDAECSSDTPWCRSGTCVALLSLGSDCTISSRCAPGLSCTSSATGAYASDASDPSDGGDGDDGGDGGAPICADGPHPYGACTCRW